MVAGRQFLGNGLLFPDLEGGLPTLEGGLFDLFVFNHGLIPLVHPRDFNI